MIAGYAVVITAAIVTVAWMSVVRERPSAAQVASGAPLGAGVLELPSDARIVIQPGAVASLVRDDVEGTVLRVDQGTTLAAVVKRVPGQPFVVLAREVRVEVVGTTFAVAVRPDGSVGVRGYEGRVRVRGRGVDVEVGAGETWPTQAGAPVLDDAALAQVAMTPPAAASTSP